MGLSYGYVDCSLLGIGGSRYRLECGVAATTKRVFRICPGIIRDQEVYLGSLEPKASDCTDFTLEAICIAG